MAAWPGRAPVQLASFPSGLAPARVGHRPFSQELILAKGKFQTRERSSAGGIHQPRGRSDTRQNIRTRYPEPDRARTQNPRSRPREDVEALRSQILRLSRLFIRLQLSVFPSASD